MSEVKVTTKVDKEFEIVTTEVVGTVSAEIYAHRCGDGGWKITATYPSTIVRSAEEAQGIAAVMTTLAEEWGKVSALVADLDQA